MTTLVFSTSKGFVSRAIRWFTRSKASHVMIGIEVHNQPMLLHCTSGGVKITPRAKWFKDSTLISEWRFKDEPNVDHALSHIGDKYDYLTLFGWGAVILLWRWFRIKAKNPLQSPTAMVCSEFVVHLGEPELGANNVKDWRELDPETTHAQTLLDLMPGQSFTKV